LAGESRLVSLVRLLGKPVELSLSSSWLLQQLPEPEVEYARGARIEILLPVVVEDGSAEALLIAGPKRSEQPYSREDQDLLSAIASSLALRLSGATPARTPAAAVLCRECPMCGLCYDNDLTTCSHEGAPLIARPIPRVLSDRYRLERRVGSGGMGTVYEGIDTALDRRVAVKVIHDRLVGSAEAAARFRREARAAASFSHPNIVTVYDYGIVGGTRAFLVMELLLGRSLRDEMQRCERFPMPGARPILAGICEGVDAAHRRQLIHRDLKPENIFLDERDEQSTVKILDFGLIKSVSSDPVTETVTRTEPGLLLGTFRYIAPEQFLGDAPGLESDLWALGVICYEMLTNAMPFEAGSTEEWRKAAVTGRFTPVRKRWPEAPAALSEFFARVLSPERRERPASARELLALFDHAFGGGALAFGHSA
jgi:serine/threonine-protein kinase